MTLLDTYDFGGNDDGLAGFSTLNSPTDNDDYYTFNGTNQGLYVASDYGDESDIDIVVRFRVHTKQTSTLWKSGGATNGIAVGLSGSNLGIFGRSGNTLTSIVTSDFDVDTWYTLYCSKSKIELHDDSGCVARETGTVGAGNGATAESVGYAESQSPITYATSDADYFDGDIDYVSIYDGDSCPFPTLTVSGTVEESGSPVARTVRVYNRSDGDLLGSATSDAGDGSWSVESAYPVGSSSTVYVVCLDDDSGTQYNAQIYDRVSVS